MSDKKCLELSVIAVPSMGVLLCGSRFNSEINCRFHSESRFTRTGCLVLIWSGFGRCFQPSSGVSAKSCPPMPRMLPAPHEVLPLRFPTPRPPPPPCRANRGTVIIPLATGCPPPPPPPAWLAATGKGQAVGRDQAGQAEPLKVEQVEQAVPPTRSVGDMRGWLTNTGEVIKMRIASRELYGGDPNLGELHATHARVTARLTELQGRAAAEPMSAVGAISSAGVGSSAGASSSAGAGDQSAHGRVPNWQLSRHGWRVRTRGRGSDNSHKAARAANPEVLRRKAEWDAYRAASGTGQ